MLKKIDLKSGETEEKYEERNAGEKEKNIIDILVQTDYTVREGGIEV